MRHTFDEQVAYGLVLTERIGADLEADEWSVVYTEKIEVDDGEYRGPRQKVGQRDCRIPDILTIKNHRPIYIEGKRKKIRSPGRISGKDEHGINRDAYRDYMALDGEVMPVFLAFGDDQHPGEVLTFRVSDLAYTVRFSHERAKYGKGMPAMAYWTVDQMSSDWLGVLNRFVLAPHSWPSPVPEREPLPAWHWGPCDTCGAQMLAPDTGPAVCKVCSVTPLQTPFVTVTPTRPDP